MIGDYTRVFSVVTAMAHEPGEYHDLIYEILDEVSNLDEALVHAISIAGEAVRQWSTATGLSMQALLQDIAPAYPEE